MSARPTTPNGWRIYAEDLASDVRVVEAALASPSVWVTSVDGTKILLTESHARTIADGLTAFLAETASPLNRWRHSMTREEELAALRDTTAAARLAEDFAALGCEDLDAAGDALAKASADLLACAKRHRIQAEKCLEFAISREEKHGEEGRS